MGARNATICFVLILVLFANHGSAEKKCWGNTSGSPLCVGFLCKATCLIGGKMFNAIVKEHKCRGPALNSECYCYFCDK
ncbi:hypothetical protein CFC21_002780 [Triticum aestivum]|uniref:Knottin scorpion toxin-like domain-containing protein n=1 Tax=Triticum aestivum TaxID=4565 RepID=A0A3B5Y2B3_WHEAT|nr:hypothetical protein CFC21_002780 [Triticum aestivum]